MAERLKRFVLTTAPLVIFSGLAFGAEMAAESDWGMTTALRGLWSDDEAACCAFDASAVSISSPELAGEEREEVGVGEAAGV